MKNFLSNFVGMFTRNWGLKILALVLAVVIYYSLKPTTGQKLRNPENQNDRTLFQSR